MLLAAHMVAEIMHTTNVQKRTWNSMLVKIYNASVDHCQLILVENFILGIHGEMTQPEGVTGPHAVQRRQDCQD
ncbi:hypothetical protein BG005_002324 [Podila minutissima]|nr:hypothetical protein BG005_002324 [Podila minutissima]